MGDLEEVVAFVLYNDKLPANRKGDTRFYEWEDFLLKGAMLNFEGKQISLEERMFK